MGVTFKTGTAEEPAVETDVNTRKGVERIIGAALGGLDLATSASLQPGAVGLFEPVHGSAPDLAGTRRANQS